MHYLLNIKISPFDIFVGKKYNWNFCWLILVYETSHVYVRINGLWMSVWGFTFLKDDERRHCSVTKKKLLKTLKKKKMTCWWSCLWRNFRSSINMSIKKCIIFHFSIFFKESNEIKITLTQLSFSLSTVNDQHTNWPYTTSCSSQATTAKYIWRTTQVWLYSEYPWILPSSHQ